MTTASPAVPSSAGRRTLWAALIAAGWVAAVAVHVIRPSEAWVAAAFIAVQGGSALFAWFASGRTTPERRLPALLVAAGLTSNALGEVVWYSYVVHQDNTDASLADVGWLVAYGFIAAALSISLVRARQGEKVDIDSLIDALTIVTISVMVLWNLSVATIAGDPSLTPQIKLVWSTYPILDAILLALVIRIAADRRARSWIDPWFGVGVAAWLVADLGFLTLPLTDAHENWQNAAWMLGAILMARFHRGGTALATAAPGGRPTVSRVMVAIGPLVAPPLLVMVDVALGREVQVWPLVVGTLVLAGLAYVRTSRFLTALQQAQVELEETRDAALQASRAKSEFLATMSHEIRTPMNGVIGLSDLLLQTDLDDRQRQFANGVNQAGGVLLNLINEILDFSKVEAGRLELEVTDVDLAAVVEETADLVAHEARARGLELVVDLDPELPALLRGDPVRLRQILLNLAENAVKFTEAGEVVLRARSLGHDAHTAQVRLEVVDTGIGIEPELQERLFEVFAQADSSPTRLYGGTGLGLAISRQLVALMDGQIGVDSAPGRGSTFWVTLPLELSPVVGAGDEPPRLDGLRVLVVDDNGTTLDVLQRLLEQWGAVADTATGGAAAIAALGHQATYDVVLLDVELSDSEALTLSRGIVEAGRDHPQVVLLTGGVRLDQAQVRAVGASACLGKPVHRAQLRGVLADIASTRRLTTGHRDVLGRVLVVDENQTNQLITSGMVEFLGYLVTVAGDEVEALVALSRDSYDAVLLDCRPGEGSFRIADAIRGLDDARARVPIIAMSTSEEPGRIAGLRESVDDHLQRPIGVGPLGQALERWTRVSAVS